MSNDLSLIPVEDLLAEIDKRFDCIVMATSKFNGENDVYDWHVNGYRMACIGMAVCMATKLQNDIVGEETDGFFKD